MVGFIVPKNKAGYFLGGKRGIGGLGPLGSHEIGKDGRSSKKKRLRGSHFPDSHGTRKYIYQLIDPIRNDF